MNKMAVSICKLSDIEDIYAEMEEIETTETYSTFDIGNDTKNNGWWPDSIGEWVLAVVAVIIVVVVVCVAIAFLAPESLAALAIVVAWEATLLIGTEIVLVTTTFAITFKGAIIKAGDYAWIKLSQAGTFIIETSLPKLGTSIKNMGKTVLDEIFKKPIKNVKDGYKNMGKTVGSIIYTFEDGVINIIDASQYKGTGQFMKGIAQLGLVGYSGMTIGTEMYNNSKEGASLSEQITDFGINIVSFLLLTPLTPSGIATGVIPSVGDYLLGDD